EQRERGKNYRLGNLSALALRSLRLCGERAYCYWLVASQPESLGFYCVTSVSDESGGILCRHVEDTGWLGLAYGSCYSLRAYRSRELMRGSRPASAPFARRTCGLTSPSSPPTRLKGGCHCSAARKWPLDSS